MTNLPYRVECKSSYPFYELIAAFNVEAAAIGYTDECATANADTTYEYRVTKNGKVIAKWER